jgi:hypothetical protein
MRTFFDDRSHALSAAGALIILVLSVFLSGCSATVAPDATVRLEVILDGGVAPGEPATAALDGATLYGEVTVLVHSTEPIDDLVVRLDADDIAPNTSATSLEPTAPWSIRLNTIAMGDGEHSLGVTVYGSGGAERHVEASFTVANETVLGASFGWFEVPPATLYVATNGNDDNTGRTTHDPLRTIQRAANIAQPGDTIYIRAGTYPIQVQFTRSGTTNQPITWTSYPGETAILDGSNQTPATSQHRVWVSNARHNVFANLEIRNSPREGIIVQDAHDNLFTHLHIHGNHYSGILNMRSDRNTYQYITTHNNYDRYNPDGRIGDDADGISISTGDSNTLYRIIAYNNSDDGIDAWRSTNTTIDSSIAFNNGRGSHGDGNGIKAGGNNEHNNTLVRNNIAFNNKANGFDYNSGRNITFVNNTAYNNGRYDYAFGDTTTLRNNLSINGRIGAWGGTHNHNSWNLDITNPNLTSTDPTHPHFLTLTDTSPARNAGTTTQPTTSTDLGAIPYGHTITTITTHALALHLDIMAQTPH